MVRAQSPRSSTLLLLRLSVCPADEAAWGEFVTRYGATIYRWCRRYGLQDTDAQDVTQNVFAGLLRAVRTFDRSRGRVRTWLFRVVANEVCDWCNSPAHRHERGTGDARRALASEPAVRELEARLGDEFDLELLEVAEQGVRLQVKPEVWSSYRLRCKEGLSLRQAAERIDLPAGHVSKYAVRVREMVARRIVLLEGAGGTAPGGVTSDPSDDLPPRPDVAGVRL
jgi:RNA polymerase sigma-70 factor (ECF subfamily)